MYTRGPSASMSGRLAISDSEWLERRTLTASDGESGGCLDTTFSFCAKHGRPNAATAIKVHRARREGMVGSSSVRAQSTRLCATRLVLAHFRVNGIATFTPGR